MKIALILPYDLARPGGVRSHILGLGEALVQRGHVVEVIAPSDATALGTLPVVSCGTAQRAHFGGTQIDMTWAPWKRVSEVCRRGYDVMHFHTIWNPLVPFQLAARFRGPKVATFHDVPGPDTPAWAAKLMSPMSEGIRRVALKKVIAVSPAVSRYLLPGLHEVIPNGISVPTPLPHDGERRAVLYLGRLEPRKDVATLLSAVAQLRGNMPPLWIAGDGPLRSQLEKQARELGVAATFFGEVTDDEKWSLLRRARMLVAPSTGGESFGIVLLEAMAGGAVPLAADNPGYHDLLIERGDDLLFPVSDAPTLAARIRALAANDSRLRNLREWGETYWQQFDWSRLATRIERVYESAISS
ncbi:MAG TPA: glycosyltransferase family 4 protein [Gemmatimonadaceae bacterium]|jgi:phosphatidylinositol alpha-mannosyltransferase